MLVCFKVCGIKGIPILSLLPYFDLVYGIVLDDLHCIDLGVVKALLLLWFDKSHRNEPYSLYSQVRKLCYTYFKINIYIPSYCKMQTCNKRLLSISVPNTISRSPTSLENVACWKGTCTARFPICIELYFSSHRVRVTVMVTILLNTCTTGHNAAKLF